MRKPFPLFLLPLLLSCGGPVEGKPILAASFYPIGFLAEQIAGDKYDVVTITPPGAEPHDYELTPSSVRALSDAKAIFTSGLSMEPWGDSLPSYLSSKRVELSQGIKTIEVEGRVDPHIWLSLDNYLEMGRKVKETLSSLDKGNEAYFSANFASFSEKVAELKGKCEEIASCFPEGKVIAVAHAAYGYMARDFGFKQLYISSLSPDEEPSQQAIERLLDAIKEYGIDTVFFEELASDKAAKAIAQATGAKTESLNPLEGIDEGEDYFSVYLENMEKIKEAKP